MPAAPAIFSATCLCLTQVALMPALHPALAAIEANIANELACESGASFLAHLSISLENEVGSRARSNVNVKELRLGFTARNPEGILSHNNRES